ncbi:MAG: DUF420 domain-containing protein [Planctomycetes bacterium]|nr:DUF420 domain-containing protein [Planctomycetota bacterium]
MNQIICPGWNASLNALAGFLIIAGFLAIKLGKNKKLHSAIMLGAVAVSAIFLASYLYYHLVIKEGVATSFRDRNPDASDVIRYLYFTILISHTILAIVVTPMILVTAYHGIKDNLSKHMRLARITFPIWLYVSITGVVVYWMLYRMN